MAQYDLKRLRKEKDMTQQELAKRLNLSQGFLSSVECGRNPFPDERVDELQSLFPDISLEDYESIQGSKEAKIEIGNHNTDSEIKIYDPDSMSTLITFLKTTIEDSRKDKRESTEELVNLRARNEKLTERYDRMVDELEETRRKLFDAREEIWNLKAKLSEYGIKETEEATTNNGFL